MRDLYIQNFRKDSDGVFDESLFIRDRTVCISDESVIRIIINLCYHCSSHTDWGIKLRRKLPE